MAKKGSVNIKIGGDASAYEQELNESVKATEAAAQKIDSALSDAAKSLSDGLTDAYKAAQKEQEKAVKSIGNNASKIATQNNEIIEQKGKLGTVYDKLGDGAKTAAVKVRAGLADIKAGIDMAASAANKLAEVAAKGVNYNATIESLQTSFEVMTGSAEKAADVVDRLRTMGAETPFEMADLAGTTQLLMQYGFTADDAIAKMSMLGDIAQGNAQAMTSIATGYAQMSSAGKVNLQDIKQMINAGFNPLQEISERTGESMASLYDRISKGSMKVDEITKSMQMATSEGGKFYQSMEKQSKTLNGQLSTLKDNADQLLGTLTSGLSEGLRDEFLPLANNMIGELQNAFETGGIQGLSDAATAMIPNLLDMMSGEFEKGITAIGKWLPKGTAALMKHVPQGIKSASNVTSQITTALFDVASVVLTDLTAMLPELLPAMLEGFGGVFLSALKGVGNMVNGLFTGIEQAFHQEQRKIAGVWIDEEKIAKYNLKIDMSVESDAAKEEIYSAYSDLREALDTDLLTDEQRNEIMGMIDADYQTIYDKLISFSVPPEDAEVLAANITASSEAVIKHLESMDVGVDGKTLYKWMVQASDSRIALRQTLKKQGLTDDDIEQVVAVFDNMNGRISAKTPNVAEHIFAELTDGLKDDPDALKADVIAYLNAQDKAIDDAYNEAVSKLDPTDSDYATKLATLNADYASAKADLKTIGSDLDTLVDTLANASTATVQSKYKLFADVETQVNDLERRIDELSGKALTLGQQAYNVVRSGAQADEDTISQAVSFKISEFKIDEQSAEDAYAKARDELNAKLNSANPDEKISVDEYNRLLSEAEATKDAAIQAAKEEFNRAFSAMIQGIAESEGNGGALNKAMQLHSAKISIEDFIANMFDAEGKIDMSKLTGITNQLSAVLGDAFDAEKVLKNAEKAEYGNEYADMLNGILLTQIEGIDIELTKAQEEALSGKVGATWGAIIESGILSGTDFEVTEASKQLSVLLSGIASTATSAMEDYDGGKKAGKQTIAGYEEGLAESEINAYKRGQAIARAFIKGYKETAEIASPSKAMRRMGKYTGEGLELGLQDSMSRAVATAKRLTGQIVTAADMSSSVRVNMPNLSQEIAFANEQNKTPVYLNGVQIAEIQGHNNSMQLAWQNTKAAKGVGSR